MDAPNLQSDLRFLKRKVEAGAEFLVTQMFFDNQYYFNFVKQCRENGINVPIIPGIKPLSSKKQLSVLPKIFHIDLPDELVNSVESCQNNQQVQQAGIDWAIRQCQELIAHDVPVLHFYTMGKSEQTKQICKAIF
jgi:methylenetetrahydrofolate reductase (NADPH)